MRRHALLSSAYRKMGSGCFGVRHHFKTEKLKMTFKQLLAKYVTGNLPTDQLPNIGITGIEEGLDSPSLLILAGLSKNESLYEIEHYFKRTIEELKIELPDKRKASIELASAIIDEIHAGEKDLIEGLREIRNQVLDSYDFYTESKNYCYDSIGFEKIYGLYDSFEDLSNADYSRQLHKSNKQLMAELKEELLTELKIWNEKIKNGA